MPDLKPGESAEVPGSGGVRMSSKTVMVTTPAPAWRGSVSLLRSLDAPANT